MWLLARVERATWIEHNLAPLAQLHYISARNLWRAQRFALEHWLALASTG